MNIFTNLINFSSKSINLRTSAKEIATYICKERHNLGKSGRKINVHLFFFYRLERKFVNTKFNKILPVLYIYAWVTVSLSIIANILEAYDLPVAGNSERRYDKMNFWYASFYYVYQIALPLNFQSDEIRVWGLRAI